MGHINIHDNSVVNNIFNVPQFFIPIIKVRKAIIRTLYKISQLKIWFIILHTISSWWLYVLLILM